jgi:probable addiction module antidote protein
MRKNTSKIARPALRRIDAEAGSSYEKWLVERLRDPADAAAYIQAVIEDGDQAAMMLALRQVVRARGGIPEIARRAELTREAVYRMLFTEGNPELRSMMAILAASGLRLTVEPAEKLRRKVA